MMLVCSSPRAEQRLEVEEKIECGMVLLGSEVKSLRLKRGDLEGSYAQVQNDELFLVKMHIAPYEYAGVLGHETKRTRKLLAKKREIERLRGRLTTGGYTLLPTRVYFKDGYAKVELALGKGKRTGDKRETIKRELDMKEARAAMDRGRRK